MQFTIIDIIFVLAVIILFVLVFRLQKTATVQARGKIVVPPGGIEFVNPDGKLVAKLQFGSYGGTVFVCDHHEKVVGGFSALENGGALALYDHQGKTLWSVP